MKQPTPVDDTADRVQLAIRVADYLYTERNNGLMASGYVNINTTVYIGRRTFVVHYPASGIAASRVTEIMPAAEVEVWSA
ncbi:hypothetical protein GCM10009765_58790 [Fodinicola feengrottensis]|uniref:Uncharacterized protein n=1 Tax=Fodinicola feengrottensis TaxID=435914 RepID=A0ABN2IAU3_9ACTN